MKTDDLLVDDAFFRHMLDISGLLLSCSRNLHKLCPDANCEYIMLHNVIHTLLSIYNSLPTDEDSLKSFVESYNIPL